MLREGAEVINEVSVAETTSTTTVSKVELIIVLCTCTGGREEHGSYFVTMPDGQGSHY